MIESQDIAFKDTSISLGMSVGKNEKVSFKPQPFTYIVYVNGTNFIAQISII